MFGGEKNDTCPFLCSLSAIAIAGLGAGLRPGAFAFPHELCENVNRSFQNQVDSVRERPECFREDAVTLSFGVKNSP